MSNETEGEAWKMTEAELVALIELARGKQIEAVDVIARDPYGCRELLNAKETERYAFYAVSVCPLWSRAIVRWNTDRSRVGAARALEHLTLEVIAEADHFIALFAPVAARPEVH